ncbi:hypothetical protein OG599_14350 [Streptomyces sp. NBC_01335]|uniref:hypothetical protein n=1 Tax=Streptomyces sp. NBC_01335 TaxID=2903828 RepID=UPI002E1503F2|nr:hypothetical protein OG599_14350 [Streptomyces sp. NBC_01335]
MTCPGRRGLRLRTFRTFRALTYAAKGIFFEGSSQNRHGRGARRGAGADRTLHRSGRTGPGSTGALKTTVTASADGYWRWTFGGTPTTGTATATGDYVDVR